MTWPCIESDYPAAKPNYTIAGMEKKSILSQVYNTGSRAPLPIHLAEKNNKKYIYQRWMYKKNEKKAKVFDRRTKVCSYITKLKSLRTTSGGQKMGDATNIMNTILAILT